MRCKHCVTLNASMRRRPKHLGMWKTRAHLQETKRAVETGETTHLCIRVQVCVHLRAHGCVHGCMHTHARTCPSAKHVYRQHTQAASRIHTAQALYRAWQEKDMTRKISALRHQNRTFVRVMHMGPYGLMREKWCPAQKASKKSRAVSHT